MLDEPTTGLDPIGTREMKDLIIRLREEGKTVLLCSHLLPDIQDVCDRIAILHQGELKELGRIDTLLTVQDETQIRAKGLSHAAEEEIRQVIERHGGNLVGMDHPTTTLEELFLSIVRESEAHPGRRALERKETRGRRTAAARAEPWPSAVRVAVQTPSIAAPKGIRAPPWKSDRTNSCHLPIGLARRSSSS